jgi:hypothetical protein
MKTIKINIASLFMAIGFFGISLYSNSQDIKLSRQEKKEVRKAQLTENFYLLDSLLNSKTFVLEANFLQNRYGDRIPVGSILNFIMVDGSTGVLQTGSESNLGFNGVGGVTAEGTIGNWEMHKNLKQLSYMLNFSLLTNLGNYDVTMRVTSNNRAMATIRGLTPGQLSWEGRLRTLEDSRVFKGQNSI